MSEVGGRIRKLRKEIGQSQLSFAEALGVNRAHISRIETGSANPSNHLIKLICEKFEINENWLLYGKGEVSARKPIDKNKLIQLEKDLIAIHIDGLGESVGFIRRTIKTLISERKDPEYKPFFSEYAAKLTSKDKNVILLKNEISKTRAAIEDLNNMLI